MNIAIVGSSGYIGRYLCDELAKSNKVKSIKKIDKFGKYDFYLDLLEPEKFKYDCLKDIDIVIFTAAIASPDMCAKQHEFAWKINVTGTSYFIKKSISNKTKVLFFSSDAVFGSDSLKICTEETETKAYTDYGKMKKIIEDKFKLEHYFKCIRLSYVVSDKDKFVSYCYSCLNENKVAEVFHPFYRNCIIIDDVKSTVNWLILNWEEYKYFALNVAGDELISRIRIADEITMCNKDFKYEIIIPDNSFFENRDRITQMNSNYINSIIGKEKFSEKIRKVLGEYKCLQKH